MPTVPFSIPVTPIDAGRTVILANNGQPFAVPSTFKLMVIDLFAAGAWQHRVPENNVIFAIERFNELGVWIVWASGNTTEGVVSIKGGTVANITLNGTGHAETARIAITADQAVPGGVSGNGSITT